MRTRSQGVLVGITSNVKRINHACVPGVTYSALTDCGVRGEVRVTTDQVTPGWYKRKGNGEVIINPFYSTFNKGVVDMDGPTYGNSTTAVCNPAQNVSYAAQKDLINKYTGVQANFRLIPLDKIDRVIEQATTQAWASVQREEMQILVFLAELKRTISMLANPLSNFSRFLTKVRSDKNSSKRAADHFLTTGQYLAREWLTYRFGWLQLYRDAYNITKALHKKEETGLLRSFGNAKLSEDLDSSFTVTNFSSVVDLNYNRRQTHNVYVRCGLYYMGSRSTNVYLGFSPEHIVDAFWELIPYSFVVDWVVGVGSYLKALIRQLSVPIKGNFTTVTEEYVHLVTCTGATLKSGAGEQGWSISQNAQGTSTWYKREKRRLPGILPPHLILDLKIQELLDVRVLDSIALILNLGRRK